MKGQKTGGRAKGTPNKDTELKAILRRHSAEYFRPRVIGEGENAREASDFDLDMETLNPQERVTAEIRLMEFHTPKMKSVDIDLAAQTAPVTIEDKLRLLCRDPNADPDTPED